jgi:hypothetical protein
MMEEIEEFVEECCGIVRKCDVKILEKVGCCYGAYNNGKL